MDEMSEWLAFNPADRPPVTDDATQRLAAEYPGDDWPVPNDLPGRFLRAAAARVQPRRPEGGGVNRRDLQLLAEGLDKCVKSLRYEDGSPVEIVSNSNPYRKELEGLDTKEDK